MALCSKKEKKGYRVYCLLGDGELEEGEIWESAMTSSRFKLDNLCVIVDCNGLQLSGNTDEIKCINAKSIDEKFKSFGFHTIQINGNYIYQILQAFQEAKETKNVPTCIIAKTVKGKRSFFYGK